MRLTCILRVIILGDIFSILSKIGLSATRPNNRSDSGSFTFKVHILMQNCRKSSWKCVFVVVIFIWDIVFTPGSQCFTHFISYLLTLENTLLTSEFYSPLIWLFLFKFLEIPHKGFFMSYFLLVIQHFQKLWFACQIWQRGKQLKWKISWMYKI